MAANRANLWDLLCPTSFAFALIATLSSGLAAQHQKISEKQPKPTELVVTQYEKFVADGALLTPEGWTKASRLCDKSDPYPENGVIVVRSAGGAIGEDWVKGDRAQVETNWNDLYGEIDTALRYKPTAPGGGGVAMIQEFPLVCVGGDPNRNNSVEQNEGCAGSWKIEGPQQSRAATILVVIRYLSEMRDKSRDAVIRKNADRTIAILRTLVSGCGLSASAC